MLEKLKEQLLKLIESRGQTMKNYESLLKYYQTSLGWSEEEAIKYVIGLFDNGTMDEIINLGKGDDKVMKCCVCGKEIVGYGNSPSPLNGSKCCDECNINVVIPLRIFLRGLESQEYALLVKEKEVQLVKPDDKYFTLKELQTAVNGYIEVVPSIFRNYLDVLNEEGKLKGLYFNIITYLLLDREYVGNVLICPTKIFEKPEEE